MEFFEKIPYETLKYKKFQNNNVKILLISSKYFLLGEIITALKKLGISYDSLFLNEDEYLTEEFVKFLINKIKNFKPDFVFTINHLGIDREGILTSIFEKIEMPLVSWYVDNPNLIIKFFEKNISDLTLILVWDKDNIDDMKKIGFKHVFYLPLGVDTNRFKKISINQNPFLHLKNDVVFVGNSMIDKVEEMINKTKLPEKIIKFYKKIAVKFIESENRSVEDFIKLEFPDFFKIFQLFDNESKIYFETLVTWEATRIYRYKCVKSIIKFSPLIVGDKSWLKYFRNINYHPPVTYYTELPYIYNIAKVNFNTTSLQMKNAVNQRVFDVPACQQFLVTDYRKQLEELFEIGKEVVVYETSEEIEEIIERFLNYPKEREKIIKKAYKRVIAEHKYTDRVLYFIEVTKKIFS